MFLGIIYTENSASLIREEITTKNFHAILLNKDAPARAMLPAIAWLLRRSLKASNKELKKDLQLTVDIADPGIGGLNCSRVVCLLMLMLMLVLM